MSLFPENPNLGQQVQGATLSVPALRKSWTAHWQKTPAAPNTTAVMAATSAATTLNVSTGLTNPDVARNVTATTTGTAGNVTAQQVVVTGTDLSGAMITETLPAFSNGSLTTVTGNKAFATVTNITCPTVGASVSVSVGLGSKLGLHHIMPHNTVMRAVLNNVVEGVAPTVANDAVNLSGNTCALNSALPGAQVVDLYYWIP